MWVREVYSGDCRCGELLPANLRRSAAEIEGYPLRYLRHISLKYFPGTASSRQRILNQFSPLCVSPVRLWAKPPSQRAKRST